MLDRDLSVPFLPRYIRPYQDAATCQRADTKHERSAAVSHHGPGSARVRHHRPGHAGEMSGKYTKGYD